MTLIVEPDDGIDPIVTAINKAKTAIDIGIFRLDRGDIAKALKRAVDRGVPVRTLIAHTNHGGEKKLRKLEQHLLQTGATVSRTDDDLRRYHNKIMIIDRKRLYVLGFNYTVADVNKSRSFGVITKKPELVREALKVFEADSLRKPYTAGPKTFLVSPLNARERLTAFLKGARKSLMIYDPKLTDPTMIRILHQRRAAGVSVRILGKLGKRGSGLLAEKLPGMRLHVRAIVRDEAFGFVGSQGLRKLELDARREVGLITNDRKVVSRMASVFESDWAKTDLAKEAKKAEEGKGKDEKAKDEKGKDDKEKAKDDKSKEDKEDKK
jgi:cardiolipin synthase A/B